MAFQWLAEIRKIFALNISPFILRELKVALRQQKFSSSRYFAALVVTCLTIVFLLLFWVLLDFAPASVGKYLFYILLILAAVELAPLGDRASLVLADEQRNNTLPLLFSTGIRPAEVLAGKVLAMLVLPVSRLITIVPCLLIIPLTRGATADMCLAAILTIFVSLALVVSLNLFCCVLFKEHSTSRIFADSLLLLLIGLVPAISWLNSSFLGATVAQEWLCLNPGYAPWLLFDTPHSNRNLKFIYLSLLFSSGLTSFFFAATAFRLSRMWKDQFSERSPFRLASILTRIRKHRAAIAKPILDSNPYDWLIYRDSHPMIISALVLGACALVWLLGLWTWGASWLIPMNFWATFLLLSVVIRAIASYIAARQIAIDRNSGGLELILTSPLPVEEIVAGQQNALRRYIRPFYWFAALLLLAFWLIGVFALPMTHTQKIHFTILTIFVAIFGPWYSIQQFWPAFWVSLNTGRPALHWRTSAWQKGYYLWIFFALLRGGSWSKIPTGSYGEGIFVAVCGIGALIGYIIYRYSHKPYSVFPLRDLALQHMRAIAAEPVPEANDPRLKNWNQQSPLFPVETSYEKLERPLSPTAAA